MKKFLLFIVFILFVLFSFLFWGGSYFSKMSVENTITTLKDSIDFSKKELFRHSELQNHPSLLRKYFTTVIDDSVNKPKFVTVKQTAQFKTDITSEWMPITATQYFTTDEPNFLWYSKMQSSSFFWVNAIDSYINGQGNMLIKLNSSITVADSWGIELDKSGLFRYISEAILFPTKLLPSENLQWNILDSNNAEIKFTDNNNSVVAKLYFANNLIYKIDTYDKYRALEEGYERSLYTIYLENYKRIHQSFLVPTYIEVEWNLSSGKFKYGKFTIEDVIYE